MYLPFVCLQCRALYGIILYNIHPKGAHTMKQTNLILAENIKKFRKQRGMTQEEFSNRLGLSYQAVSKWETGKTAPDVFLLPSIAEVFECSIDDLFSFLAKNKQESLHILPGDSVPDSMKQYLSAQIRDQLDHNGSTNPFLQIMADNLSGSFDLTDENIERLLDAYRELYRGVRKKQER